MKDKEVKLEETEPSRTLGDMQMFIMNQEDENYRQDLYMSVGAMKD